ncbi:class I SAM-dependent methyltransferase [Rhodopila sp.]|uniref:class I SAM-dependent methyltransferase n=1 Tax=Rhodopila sp. TaxID=2480087 RepID=UPI003D0DBB33
MNTVRKFVALNRRICQAITPRSVHEANVFGVYRKVGTMLLSHPEVGRVLDVGAGKAWHFPEHYKKWYGIHLIGADIDAEEMRLNTALDERIVADVAKFIPVREESVDLVMANSGMEHFADNEQFLRNVFSVLRPGGFFVAQFPSRYAPFAIVNRMLSPRLGRRLLRVTTEDATELGFRAFYDRTQYSSFRKMYKTIGFRELYHVPGFYSSFYFEFFVPLWCVSYLYDVVRFSIGNSNLASYHLWVLQKPVDGVLEDSPFRFYAW